MLNFSLGNAKVGKGTAIFDLPAGWSCPCAKACLSRVNPVNGKIEDGKDCAFRCYAASTESRFSHVRQYRWHNYNKLKSLSGGEMAMLIKHNLPEVLYCRIHSSGDFFSWDYLMAWARVASITPETLFYAYTKTILWAKEAKRRDMIPPNLRLIASYGGKQDILIPNSGLISARVVFSELEASLLGLEIDHDDKLARQSTKDFALLIHGVQPTSSLASKAYEQLKKQGKFGYSKKTYGRHHANPLIVCPTTVGEQV